MSTESVTEKESVRAKIETMQVPLDTEVHVVMQLRHAKALVALLGPFTKLELANFVEIKTKNSLQAKYVRKLAEDEDTDWSYDLYNPLFNIVQKHAPFHKD